MAITHRIGAYKDFEANKLLPGEVAVVLSGDPRAQNGRSIYACYAAGVVKQIATYEDMVDFLKASISDTANQIAEELMEVYASDITKAINDAQNAKAAANSAATAASSAANSASEASETANTSAIEANEAAKSARAAAEALNNLKAKNVAIDPISGMMATTVQDAISEQNSKIEQTIVLKDSTGGMKFVKVGKIVFFSNWGDITSAVEGDMGSPGRVPSGFEPASTYYVMALPHNKILITINNTGLIQAYNYGSAQTSPSPYRFSGCYVSKS